jgi:preprotein translocase subunit YajC
VVTQGGMIGKIFQVEDKTVTLDFGGGNKVRFVKGQIAGSWSDETGSSEKDLKEKK